MSKKKEIEIGHPIYGTVKYSWETLLKDVKTDKKYALKILKSKLTSIKDLEWNIDESEIKEFIDTLINYGHYESFNENERKLVKDLKDIWIKKKEKRIKETQKKIFKYFGLWNYSGKIRNFETKIVLRISDDNSNLKIDIDYNYFIYADNGLRYNQLLKIYYDVYFDREDLHIRYKNNVVIRGDWNGCSDYVEDNYILRLTDHNQKLEGVRISVNGEIPVVFEKIKRSSE